MLSCATRIWSAGGALHDPTRHSSFRMTCSPGPEWAKPKQLTADALGGGRRVSQFFRSTLRLRQVLHVEPSGRGASPAPLHPLCVGQILRSISGGSWAGVRFPPLPRILDFLYQCRFLGQSGYFASPPDTNIFCFLFFLPHHHHTSIRDP